MEKTLERALWPGITSLQVEYEREAIDVTAFGDASAKYVAGLTRCRLMVECDQDAMARLLSLMEQAPPEIPGRPEPSKILIARPVRIIDAEGLPE